MAIKTPIDTGSEKNTLSPSNPAELLNAKTSTVVLSSRDTITNVTTTPKQPEIALQKDILAAWTGVDHTVYEALDNTDVLWETLIKELAILAELGKAGSGQRLSTLISETVSSGLSYEGIANDFNALVEYGDLFINLTPSQREKVSKREIQDEFGHFWRIMGIDSMFSTKTKKIAGEFHDVIWWMMTM